MSGEVDQFKGADGKGWPIDIPEIRSAPPWDPDPLWQIIAELTEAGQLHAAIALVQDVPGSQLGTLLDDVIYLRFLTESEVRADDIRFLARKYAKASLISGCLLEEFDLN